MIDEIFLRFAVALGIGLLLGLERGWHTRADKQGQRTAGIRTFALSALLGATTASLAQSAAGSPTAAGIVVGLCFLSYSLVFAAFTREENRARKTFSATTTIAGMLTFALSAYAVLGDSRVAAAASVTAAGLLAARTHLHRWVRNISWAELRAALSLLTMTFVALPLLPNLSLGPYGGINPREIWIIAIVLAGLSFFAYAASRQIGARHGIMIASSIGAIVSSTAVTITNAQRSRENPGAARLLAGGVAVAIAVCLVRILLIAAAMRPTLIDHLALPLLAGAVVAGLSSYALTYANPRNALQSIKVGNPFAFWPVIGFAVFLAAIMFAIRAATEHFGVPGVIFGAIAVGFTEVDAITLSIVRNPDTVISDSVAATAILAAAVSNTVTKAAIAALVGGKELMLWVAIPIVLSLLASGIGAWFTGKSFILL